MSKLALAISLRHTSSSLCFVLLSGEPGWFTMIGELLGNTEIGLAKLNFILGSGMFVASSASSKELLRMSKGWSRSILLS